MMDDMIVDSYLSNLLVKNIKDDNFEQAFSKTCNYLINKIKFFKPFLDNAYITNNSESFNFLKQTIRKVSVDFFVYNLFKINNQESIDSSILKLVDEIKDMNSEKDIEDYFLKNENDFKIILWDYYKFHCEDEEFIKMVIANSINMGYEKEVFRLNNRFYNNYDSYYNYILNEKIQKGLLFVEQYDEKNSIDSINKFLNMEFDDPVVKNHFISYILSNVYAYLKINNITGEKIDKIIMLTEKMSFRMSCFYDNEEFLNYIFKTYFNIYKDTKVLNFKDIRNFASEEHIDVIKLLDRDYVSHFNIIKNPNYISTITNLVENDIIGYLTLCIDKGMEDDMVLKRLKNVVLGKTKIPSYSGISQSDLIINLRLLIITKYYEFINLKYDEVEIDYQTLYDMIDDDIDSLSALKLLNDEDNLDLLVEIYYEYLFESYKVDYEAKNKIIEDRKFTKLVKIYPNILLDYRKILGFMFPTESLETVDLTNDIIGTINNIIAANVQAKVCDEKTMYSEIAQVIKNSCDDYQFTVEEMTGCLICNIYERLKLKKKLSSLEQEFINTIEDEYFEIEEIIEDDGKFEQLIIMFKDLNEYYLDIESLRKIRNNTKRKGKIKVLEKFDPNYYADKAFFDN